MYCVYVVGEGLPAHSIVLSQVYIGTAQSKRRDLVTLNSLEDCSLGRSVGRVVCVYIKAWLNSMLILFEAHNSWPLCPLSPPTEIWPPLSLGGQLRWPEELQIFLLLHHLPQCVHSQRLCMGPALNMAVPQGPYQSHCGVSFTLVIMSCVKCLQRERHSHCAMYALLLCHLPLQVSPLTLLHLQWTRAVVDTFQSCILLCV